MTKAPTAAASNPAAPAAKPPSKPAAVIKLLTSARGATVAEMQAATNWQPHSVRAYLSGLRKAGRTLGKEERKSGETSYRLVTEGVAKRDSAPTTNVTADTTSVDANAGASA